MSRSRQSPYVGLAASVLLAPAALLSGPDQSRDFNSPSCRTASTVVADAYILANPIYSYFFGELEPYVRNNRGRFEESGDATQCAAALSQAFLAAAIQLYDPADMRMKQELDARLGSYGIEPGPAQPSASSQVMMISMQLSRLARVLPPASRDDFGPLQTPTTELEQMQLMAGQVFRMLVQNGDMREILAQLEPLIRQAGQLEHQIVRQAAERLATASGS